MRIGLITAAMDERKAGIGIYSYNLTKSLLKIDKKNEYVLIHQRHTDDEIYRENEELVFTCPRIPLRKTICNNLILSWKIKNLDFDIVHDLSQVSPFLFSSSSKKILTIHDLTPVLFPETHGLIHAYMQKHVVPMTLKNIQIIIADSENTKRDIANYFKISDDKIKVVYIGIDEKFRPSANARNIREKYNIGDYFILYVGTLEPRKNIPTLIRAFYIAQKKGVNCKLIIAGGEGWKYQGIYKAVEDLKLSNSIIFLGYVPDDDLPQLYSAADLFIYPSLYEGFGLPPLEAMACGCPVISSNTSSLPEVVGEAGLMVNPYDADEIANAIYKGLNDEKLREKMIEKGLERAKTFSWKKCAEKTLEVYESVGDAA